ncbi:redox-sensing transcriptional repressor Rex, partial [bacterium]|nr:redox-sensing transcriptional repressor Rex [bacterium]
MHTGHVPPTTVQRLPQYLRVLVSAQSQRMDVISSAQIADMTGTNAPQVRKDLSYLGEFGVRGQGYEVDGLVQHLARWLGLRATRRACIIGYGRIGSALVGYAGFQDRGVSIVAAFDEDPDKIGLATGSGL